MPAGEGRGLDLGRVYRAGGSYATRTDPVSRSMDRRCPSSPGERCLYLGEPFVADEDHAQAFLEAPDLVEPAGPRAVRA